MQAYRRSSTSSMDGSFFSFDEFLKEFNVKTNYYEYFKVISALRQYKNVFTDWW